MLELVPATGLASGEVTTVRAKVFSVPARPVVFVSDIVLLPLFGLAAHLTDNVPATVVEDPVSARSATYAAPVTAVTSVLRRSELSP